MYISEEEKASISSILPILYGIIENLSITDEDLVTIKEFKVTVTESIKRRWSLDNLCPILALSAILDARFKQLKFLEDIQKSAIIDALKSNLEIVAEVQEDQEPQDCVIVDEIDEEGSSHPQVKDKVSTIDSSETPDAPLAKRCKKNQPWIFYLDQKKMKKALPSRMS